MSASPPEKADVEQGDPTPENSEQMDRGDGEGARDAAYNELDVKEQDRWLPIANGWLPRYPFFTVLRSGCPRTHRRCHAGSTGAESAAQSRMSGAMASVAGR